MEKVEKGRVKTWSSVADVEELTWKDHVDEDLMERRDCTLVFQQMDHLLILETLT